MASSSADDAYSKVFLPNTLFTTVPSSNTPITPATPAADDSEPVNQADKPALKLFDEIKEIDAVAVKKGFDPYNSGAFDRRHTWERVARK